MSNEQGAANMNEFDHNKLIAYLLAHGQEVVSCTPETITINGQYSVDCKAVSQLDTIPATMRSIRDYLGY